MHTPIFIVAVQIHPIDVSDRSDSYMILATKAMSKEKEDKDVAAVCFEKIGLEQEKFRLGHTKVTDLPSFAECLTGFNTWQSFFCRVGTRSCSAGATFHRAVVSNDSHTFVYFGQCTYLCLTFGDIASVCYMYDMCVGSID